MNNRDSDLLRGMLKAALLQGLLVETKKIEDHKLMDGTVAAQRIRRQHMEHHPSIETSVTDKDMLLLQIDHALDDGNEDRFILLTDELKGMGVLV